MHASRRYASATRAQAARVISPPGSLVSYRSPIVTRPPLGQSIDFAKPSTAHGLLLCLRTSVQAPHITMSIQPLVASHVWISHLQPCSTRHDGCALRAAVLVARQGDAPVLMTQSCGPTTMLYVSPRHLACSSEHQERRLRPAPVPDPDCSEPSSF
jgi:hypothetical protein